LPLELIDESNFQGLENLTIVPDPQITTIVGPTDVGKSSSLRGLKWACLNLPAGDGFIRFGSKGADCLIKVDGHIIIRRRMTDGENLYSMDGVEYRAFGQGVPEPIQKVLRLSDLNFVDQHDPQYWFTLSAGEVSRQLNTIVDLGIIDETLYNVGKEVRRYQEDVRVNKERSEKSKERKEALEWTEMANQDLVRVEEIQKELLEKQNKRIELEVLAADAREVQMHRDTLKERRQDTAVVGKLGDRAMAISNTIDECCTLVEGIKKLKEKIARGYPILETLEKWWTELGQIKQKIHDLRILAAEVEQLQKKVDRGRPDISRLEELAIKYNELRKKRTDVEDLLTSISHAQMRVQSLAISAKNSQEALERESEGICPICGKTLK
jgi:DNA repair ATPase RecN